MGTLATWLATLPQLIKLVGTIANIYRSARDRRLGRAEAVAEALTVANAQLEQANAARAEAKEKHSKDPTDTAFDTDFKR